jgi:TRAP-type C4-dicarboxylate transport system permease large subunit
MMKTRLSVSRAPITAVTPPMAMSLFVVQQVSVVSLG